jgi:hypothetical protein
VESDADDSKVDVRGRLGAVLWSSALVLLFSRSFQTIISAEPLTRPLSLLYRFLRFNSFTVCTGKRVPSPDPDEAFRWLRLGG